jgi:hypothetical protein
MIGNGNLPNFTCAGVAYRSCYWRAHRRFNIVVSERTGWLMASGNDFGGFEPLRSIRGIWGILGRSLLFALEMEAW